MYICPRTIGPCWQSQHQRRDARYNWSLASYWSMMDKFITSLAVYNKPQGSELGRVLEGRLACNNLFAGRNILIWSQIGLLLCLIIWHSISSKKKCRNVIYINIKYFQSLRLVECCNCCMVSGKKTHKCHILFHSLTMILSIAYVWENHFMMMKILICSAHNLGIIIQNWCAIISQQSVPLLPLSPECWKSSILLLHH